MDTRELLELIKYHNRKYRKGTPEISDAEYDRLVNTLKKVDPNNAWFSKIEPAEVANGRKVKLPVPMKSLKKVKSMKDLQNWFDFIGLRPNDTIVITPKFDGLSLLYNEKTGMAYSRGGSENEGQNCTEHIKMAMIPECKWSKLNYTFGEFVFLRETWENTFEGNVSSETGEKYKSPRNTAAGLLNRDEPNKLLRFVDFFRYGTDEESLTLFPNYLQLYKYLCREYGQRPLYMPLKVDDITEQILNFCYNTWNDIYYCDGLVLYANDFEVWKRVGRQENTGNPNYAIAYKNPDFTETFDTKVTGVTWNISKSGWLKPIVNIETVDTGDCIMKNPTGYNAKYIKSNKIAPGAIVRVTRAGGVIPKIIQIVKDAPEESINKQWDELIRCPRCGFPTILNESGVELCCTNPDCPGKRFANIVHFYTTLEAANIGEEMLSKIFNAGYDTLKKILHISFDDLLSIDGIGEVIANNILCVNQHILDGVQIPHLMAASNCFELIGVTKAKQMFSQLSEGEQWAFLNGRYNIAEAYFDTPSFKRLPKTKQGFYKGIQRFYDFVAYNNLTILPMETKVATSEKYKGFKVCFTGIRDKLLEESIVSGGGEIVSGVSKNTTHLIVADLETRSTKADKARSLNVPIFTVEEFSML